MERTKSALKTNLNTNEGLRTFASALVARANLSAKLGMSFGTDRDLYQALGYKQTISYNEYFSQYLRHDMAAAIIDRPVKFTWKGELRIQENRDDQDTELEIAWKDLESRLKVKSILSRIDRLSGIGRWGVLLLGLSDVLTNEQFNTQAKAGSKLLYLVPFGEGNSLVNSYDQDTNSPRYGRPLTYNLKVTQVNGGGISIITHYSRVIHIVDDPLESDVEGAPRLEKVFNRLMDLEKLVGGSAEMFWRNARPGYTGEVDKDFQMTQPTKDGLRDQMDEMEHNLRRFLILEGVKINPLSQQIGDPKPNVEIQIQMISAVTGIPKRILTGSERGELSSGQDADEVAAYIQIRREDHAEPHIVRPFVDRLIELQILPKASTGVYTVMWADLFAKSEAEVVKIGMDRSTSIKNYVSTPMAETILPPAAFMEFCLGLSSDQIDLVNEMIDAQMTEEQQAIADNPNLDEFGNPINQPQSTPVVKPVVQA